MRKTYGKSTFRTIRQTFGRFASIFAIVALGVGFLVGLLSAMPDMRYSFDAFFDDVSMYDIQVLGDMGLTASDISELEAIAGLDAVQAGYLSDIQMSSDDNSYAVRMHSFSPSDTINLPALTSGRLPEKSGECVIINIPDSVSTLEAGDTLSVVEDNDANSILDTKEYIVVGFADSCVYFSIEKDSTNIGTGTIDLYLLVSDSCFSSDYYTDAYITLSGANALESLTDEYTALVSETAVQVEALADKRSEIRYQEIRSDIENQLDDAKAAYTAAGLPFGPEVAEAEQALDELKPPNWYIYTREDNESYKSLASNIDKVSAIARLFPIFFFLVAALVALTTMTRMVEDERLQIGTMKSLGYSQSAIMGKYILYAMTASVLGSVVGVSVGFKLLPTVVWNAFSMSYSLPPFYSPLNWSLALATSGIVILCTLLATINSCHSTLKEKPAQLMLVKAPEPGKRVLIERITPIWSRLKFSYKITARNLFRYKKRLLMTTIGVAGCTALLVTGFGIRDSFAEIAEMQFDVLNTYDIMAPIADEANFENEALKTVLGDTDSIAGSTSVCSENVSVINGDNSIDVNTMIPENASDLNGYFVFRNRASGKDIDFNDDSVILTEKASELLDVNVGDTLTLSDENGNSGSFTLTGICENYLQNYIYMSQAAYNSGMGLSSKQNLLIIRLTDSGSALKSQIGEELLATGVVGGVRYTSDSRDTVVSALEKMNIIVLVIILSAGALALVVLYNLTNINISERIKEIATLKVLGFTEKEVNSYINRESLLLSLIGTVFGLFLGFFLHRYIMGSAESEAMMFGRSVTAISYILSALLTMFFSVLIDLMLRRKLRSISMVESMKAPE